MGYSPWGHKRVGHDLATKTTLAGLGFSLNFACVSKMLSSLLSAGLLEGLACVKMDSVLGSAVLGPGIPSLNSQPPAEALGVICACEIQIGGGQWGVFVNHSDSADVIESELIKNGPSEIFPGGISSVACA